MTNIEGRLSKLEKVSGGGKEFVTAVNIPGGEPKTWNYKGKDISEQEYFHLVETVPGLTSYVLYRAGERVEAQEEKVTI